MAIARALVCEPEILLCDEITSALDVSVQASIVELLADLRANDGVSLLFVTHNMALVRSIADRVIVMSEGRVVETGHTEALLEAPREAYTRMLVANTPKLEDVSLTTEDRIGERPTGDHPEPGGAGLLQLSMGGAVSGRPRRPLGRRENRHGGNRRDRGRGGARRRGHRGRVDRGDRHRAPR